MTKGIVNKNGVFAIEAGKQIPWREYNKRKNTKLW